MSVQNSRAVYAKLTKACLMGTSQNAWTKPRSSFVFAFSTTTVVILGLVRRALHATSLFAPCTLPACSRLARFQHDGSMTARFSVLISNARHLPHPGRMIASALHSCRTELTLPQL